MGYLFAPAFVAATPTQQHKLVRAQGSKTHSTLPCTVSIATAAADTSISTCDSLPAAEQDDGLAATEWPAPNPNQAFVAHARDGRRYESGADISVAATVAATAAANAVGGGVHVEEAPRIRMVVADLDGTLLGPDKKVSARTLEVVRRAR